MVKNVDKASELIKRRGNKKSKKKSKLNFLYIKKPSNKVIPTIEKQSTIRLTNELLSIKSEKSVLLHFKSKI